MIARSLARWLRLGVLMRLVHWRALLVAPLTLGVRGLVVDAEGRIFLVRHSYTPGWHFPGGGVEVGETARQALARELREEGHLVLDEGAALHALYFNKRYSRRDHVAVFVVRHFHQTAAREPDWEIVAAEFFPPSALPADTAPSVGRTLAEVFEGSPIRELW